MIKINLAPPEEIENAQWYAPDLAILACLFLAGFLSLSYYLGTIRSEIEAFQIEKEEIDRNIRRLSASTRRHAELVSQIDLLNDKLTSLEHITSSKVRRYRPLVLLEHLQNFKPYGIWFQSIYDDTNKNILHINGSAFDLLFLSDFMSNLESTKIQDAEERDIRTQVVFSSMELEKIKKSKDADTSLVNSTEDSPKLDEMQKAFFAEQDKSLGVLSPTIASDADELFPEMKDFPRFDLRVKYEERYIKKPSNETKAQDDK